MVSPVESAPGGNDRARPALDLGSPANVERAATAIATGAAACVPFANVYAVVTAPTDKASRRATRAKGRQPGQVGSVTTTAEHAAAHFDWAPLPDLAVPHGRTGALRWPPLHRLLRGTQRRTDDRGRGRP